MSRPLRSTATLHLQHLLDRLQPPVVGDLNFWHIGCHIDLGGETVEVLAVLHADGETVVVTDRGQIRVGRNWPLIFVEPVATVHQIRAVTDQEPGMTRPSGFHEPGTTGKP